MTCHLYNCTRAPLRPIIGEDEEDSFAWWTDRNGNTHIDFEETNDQNLGKINSSNKNEDDLCISSSSTKLFTFARSQLLPVTTLNFGLIAMNNSQIEHNNNIDNNNNKSDSGKYELGDKKSQKASFKLGPLICRGRRGHDNNRIFVPRSCADLKAQGLTQIGYYMVESSIKRQPEIIYCDPTRLIEEIGFERRLGRPGDIKSIVAFDISIADSFSDAFRYIDFSKTHKLVDMNADMNEFSDRFVVKESGLYLFIVHAQSENRVRIQIQRNHRPVAHIRADIGHTMVGQSVLLVCAEGDEIRLFNFGGDLFEEADENRIKYFHFIGILLHST